MYKQSELVRANQSAVFDILHPPRTLAPFSGIYRCEVCGFEVVCPEDDPLPLLTHRQHPANFPVQWRLLVVAN